MGEDSFFNGLFNIMWDMETDIFSEKDKTLGLLADIVPKCRKQRKRLEAMYDCGGMDLIEHAVADRENYMLNMKRAVRVLMNEMQLSREKALFSVNQIAELWDGDLELVTEYDENENLDDEQAAHSESNPEEEINTDSDVEGVSSDAESLDGEQPEEITAEESTEESTEENTEENTAENTEQNTDSEEQNNNDENNDNEQDGEEDMIFLQDMAEGENQEQPQEEEQQVDEVQDDGGGGGEEEQPQPPRDSLFKKIAEFWCKSDLEEGRPFMIACPVGWILIFLCSALGAFLIYDIPLGDKFYVPTFAFMFSVLTSKRLYRYESSGRFSMLIGAFYLAAMGRVLWLGKGFPPIVCVPVVLAALLVFNSGKMGSFLDESKKHPFFAYIIIMILSAAVTVGAYAIQQVDI